MVESFLGLWDYRSWIGIENVYINDRPSNKAPEDRWQSLPERAIALPTTWGWAIGLQ